MKNKYKLQLSKDYTLNLDISFLKLRAGYRPGFADMTGIIGRTLWYIFFIFILSSHIFYQDQASLAPLFWVYIFSVTLLAFQILRKIVLKGEFLPTVPYDLILLTFTTLVAISLFVNSLDAGEEINIWGGPILRLYSGLSLICFWFIYYLTVINFSSKKHLDKLLTTLSYAPVVAGILNILAYFQWGEAYWIVMILLLPGWIILLLSRKSHSWIYLINIISSLYLFTQHKIAIVSFTIGFTLIAGTLILLFKNRSNLMGLVRGFDKKTDSFLKRENGIRDLITDNFEFMYIIFGTLIGVILLVWTFWQGDIPLTVYLRDGIDTLTSDQQTIKDLIIGGGLVSYGGSFITQLIHVYGVLPFVIFLGMFISISYNLKMFILKSTNNILTGKALFILLSLLAFSTYMLLAPAYDLIFVFFWIIIALAGIFDQVHIKKKLFKLSNDLLIFSTEKSYYKYIQLAAVLFVIVVTVYFLELIFDIVEYLV